jgi:MoaA/NifB/PqqE/SkfB family radical SAM enzyme
VTDSTYVALFDRSIRTFFSDALRQAASNPKRAWFMLRTLWHQKRAARVRRKWQQARTPAPAFMIISVTQKCNLHCQGCYAQAMHRPAEPELDDARLQRLVDEAQQLGTSIILIAGGEPLTRQDILQITAQHPETIFPLFTNGLLIDREMARKLSRQPQVVPVVSLEGHLQETDARRGEGTFTGATQAMANLRQAGVFFGASITVTNRNLQTVTSEVYIRELNSLGCRLFFFIDFVPVEPGSEGLVLDIHQRKELAGRISALREKVPGLYVAFPGDEELYGGCLAAGRGFVHVSPEGWLEPCPFSPYADTSLKTHSLKDALQSRLLRQIRENPDHLGESGGGCALWARREWVESLLEANGETRVA